MTCPMTEGDRHYVVTILVNTTTNWMGYRPSDVLAYDPALVLMVEADDPKGAAEAAFTVGNRIGADCDGRTWPAWARSLSVGDVVQVRGWTEADTADLTCDALGWGELPLEAGRSTAANVTAANAPGGRDLMVAAGHAAAE